MQNGKKTHKIRKSEEISCFEVLDVLFRRAEGFSCPLDLMYGGLGINKLNFLICNFVSSIFGPQNPGSGTGSESIQ
jgi:hypothetical protein